MAVVYSSDLGWTAGQDVSAVFPAQIAAMSPGDVLVLDHMYEITGSDIVFPSNFTLAGGATGAGLDVTDSGTNSGTLITLGDSNTLLDLTIQHSNAPITVVGSANATSGIDYHAKNTIITDGGKNITLKNCYFEGNVAIPVDIRGGDNLLIEDCTFDGGYYSNRWLGLVTNPTVRRCVYVNSRGDGIKTGAGDNGDGTRNARVEGSVFFYSLRDGIDTTGGFTDSTIDQCYFRQNFTALDIKEILNSSDDLVRVKNDNISITNCEFLKQGNNIVVTTLDNGGFLTTSNAADHVAQNINVEDSIFENQGDTNNAAFLVKDSYNVHWNNIQLLGPYNPNVAKLRSDYNFGMPQDINGTNVTFGDPRTELPDSHYYALAGHDHSTLTYGEGAGAVANPTVTVSYTPSATQSKRLQDAAGNEAATLTNQTVTDN